MIAVTPLITPLAVKIGTRSAIALGFGLAAVGLRGAGFVQSVLDVRRLRASARRRSPSASGWPTGRRPRPRPLRRARPGRPGIRHLEHGPIHRRVALGGSGGDDLQLRHGRPPGGGRVGRRGAGRRPLARVAAASRSAPAAGDRARAADGAAPALAAHRRRPRGGSGRGDSHTIPTRPVETPSTPAV